MFLVIFFYFSFIAFILFSCKKVLDYGKLPISSRWEVYPLPKEKGRGEYGGSYLEEEKWYEKKRRTSFLAEIKNMLEEILFLKKLFLKKRSLWWWSYALHLGLYLTVGWLALLVIVYVFSWTIPDVILAFCGGLGMTLVMVGSGGLLLKRLMEKELKIYTTGEEYFNLAFIFITTGSGFLNWVLFAPKLAYGHQLMASLFTFSPFIAGKTLSIHLFLIGLLIMYIPLSKMSHFIGKFFAFHQVLWDNDPCLPNNKISRQMEKSINDQPKEEWAAPHYHKELR